MYLTDPNSFETRINRGAFSFRSKRMDAVVAAIKKYVQQPTVQNLAAIETLWDQWKGKDPKEFGDRGQGLETDLLIDLQEELEKHPLWVYPIRVIDASSHPKFEPERWNHYPVLRSANCYAYACNDPDRHRQGGLPQPGELAREHNEDMVDPHRPWFSAGHPERVTGPEVRLAALEDARQLHLRQKAALIPLIRLLKDPVPRRVVNVPGYYLIALFIAAGKDYHWLRQDDTGVWSHKLGDAEARNYDARGNLIEDPRTCNLTYVYPKAIYNYQFETFYYAPKGGVRTGSLGDQAEQERLEQLMEMERQIHEMDMLEHFM